MRGIAVPPDGRTLVGLESSDDAGIFLAGEGFALVQTLDFITPIVDDPFTFGRVAACNSLSDVYAMGGTPLTAMNIVCFPVKKFALEVLGEILRGGLSVLTEAGVALVGGHTVDDPELKYGLSVTGRVDPKKIWRNNTLRAGDSLVLTKALGTGILGTAVKAGLATEKQAGAFAESMTTLNRAAANLIAPFDVHACTDVTGFGLAGHLKEMLGDARLEIRVEAASLPALPGARELASQGIIPAGAYRNRDFAGAACTVGADVALPVADIAFDPQTSGGLLAALSPLDAERAVERLHAAGISAARIIGSVSDGEGRILIA